jgi:hypothetical protein
VRSSLCLALMLAASLGGSRALAQSSCGAGAALGDPVFEHGVPAHVHGPDALPALMARGGGGTWSEVARVTRGPVVLVALEQAGNAAALVALHAHGTGASAYCVSLVFGDVFGGLGVEITIADVADIGGGPLLVAIELLDTRSDGGGASGNPYEPRRVIVRVDLSGGTTVLDTRTAGMAGFATAHFYFGGAPGAPVIVAARPAEGARWRYDAASGTTTRVPDDAGSAHPDAGHPDAGPPAHPRAPHGAVDAGAAHPPARPRAPHH